MSLTPVRAYRIPILRILVQLGGRSATDMIKERLPIEMKGALQPEDWEGRENELYIWWNRARCERNIMVKDGLLRPVFIRGVWEITDTGRAYLKEHERKIA